jgi:DNA-binding SARP family transcriptional activator
VISDAGDGSRTERRIWIGLLGPLSVRGDGIACQISASRHRSLLAALALSAGQTVPAADLATAVWDHDPPPGWRTTLRSYIKRTRQANPGLRSRIQTWRGGYRLDLETDDVDVLRFGRLCADAHQATWDGDWRHAADWFAEAVRLWRGEPFADIGSSVIQARRRYLHESLLNAAIGRIDALRRCGDPAAATFAARAEAYRTFDRAGISSPPVLDQVWQPAASTRPARPG